MLSNPFSHFKKVLLLSFILSLWKLLYKNIVQWKYSKPLRLKYCHKVLNFIVSRLEYQENTGWPFLFIQKACLSSMLSSKFELVNNNCWGRTNVKNLRRYKMETNIETKNKTILPWLLYKWHYLLYQMFGN